MRAITLRPPWGWLVQQGHAPVVTLDVDTDHRGGLALVCGGPYDLRAEQHDHVRAALGCTCSGKLDDPSVAECALHRATSARWAAVIGCAGGVVATSRLVDVHDARGCCKPWGNGPGFHYVLEEVASLGHVVECSGKRGVWWIPDGLIQPVLLAG